jgi:UDP-N-acetylmuramate--alanine ligase
LTNVEYDHPDCFPTPASYVQAFGQFIGRLKSDGLIVAGDHEVNDLKLFKGLPKSIRAFTYGLHKKMDYRAVDLKLNQIGGTTFDVLFKGQEQPITTVSLQIPGEHNVLNALGVVAVHHQLGNNVKLAAQSLAEFKGTDRRFDVVGEISGITVIDDYAHHPTKIAATLAAARSRYPGRRLVAVWQPHTYSRTHALANDFIRSLSKADQVIVPEIYASREKPEPFSSNELVQKMDPKKSRFIASIPEISNYLNQSLLSGDVLVVLSAGDADQVCRDVISYLKERKA